MALPRLNFSPPFEIVRLSHVEYLDVMNDTEPTNIEEYEFLGERYFFLDYAKIKAKRLLPAPISGQILERVHFWIDGRTHHLEKVDVVVAGTSTSSSNPGNERSDS